ncbi:MAG: hypothetical protein J7L66_03485, partial [Anaerolineaceae bacterium]|nr:hypothetical protein [Anaerolineaceae bacterium]
MFLLKAISDVITAGGAIISFSLFIYVLTFKMRDRVTRTFTFLLACIVVVFGADAFVVATGKSTDILFILRIQYLGLILLPTAYFFFSDALLTITGKPSKGKRRFFGYLSIFISLIFIYFNLTGVLFSSVNISTPPTPHIERTICHDFFSVFFVLLMVVSWYNFTRSYRRTSIRASRRRMLYLIISAMGPALGAFPYLLYGSSFAERNPVLFWILSIFAYAFVSISVIAMTYTVSFFGFPWPDRVIKSRLFRWVMRGPITANITLGVTTLITRIGRYSDIDVSSLVVLGMISSIVIFEYFVTLFAPVWERILFTGSERDELTQIRKLEDRLLTKNDLEQFLEMLLATLCDHLQIKGAAFIENHEGKSAINVVVGKIGRKMFKDKNDIFSIISGKDTFLNYEKYSIIPIRNNNNPPNDMLLGFLAIKKLDFSVLD